MKLYPTSSRVYGTPHEDSDYDYNILLPPSPYRIIVRNRLELLWLKAEAPVTRVKSSISLL